MKNFHYVLFLLIGFNTFSQKKVSVELLTGIGVNKKIALINEEIEGYTSFSTQINANYQFKLLKSFFAETGLGVQSYFSSGTIGISKFNATSFRLNLPFVISYPVTEKINVGVGVAIANNKDFEDIAFREKDNLRTSLVLKSSYVLNTYCNLLFLMKNNVSNIRDLYLVNQPKIDVSVGASFKIF